MQQAHRFGEIDAAEIPQEMRRQQLGQFFRAGEHLQGLLHQFADAALVNALGSRVDRRQRVGNRVGFGFAGQDAVFGMIHLDSAAAVAHFAIATDQLAIGEPVLLHGVEMIEADAEHAGAVADDTAKTAATAELDAAVDDFALDLNAIAEKRLADGGYAGAILVTVRQME